MQTLLRTWKGAMQTLLHTRSRDIVSVSRKKLKLLFLPKIIIEFSLNTYIKGVFMTYMTTFGNENNLRESTSNKAAKAKGGH